MRYQPPPGVVSAHYPAGNFAFVHGRPTASKVAVLSSAGTASGPQWLNTYTFYDKFGRIIQTQADNHLGGQDIAWNQYNFPGWLLRTRRQHSAIVDNQLQELTVNQRYTYDHAGRLLNTCHQLGDNAGDEELISSQVYNERDELAVKKLGEFTSGNFLQTIDYAYNIRGWLTDINDFSAGDLFSFKLHYNELNASVPSGGANYNGAISQVEWQVKGADNHQFYGFTYDGLDRLTAAAYIEKNVGGSYVNSDRYKTSYSYDLTGNINSLTRHGWHSATGTYQAIDNLSYTYAANGQIEKNTSVGAIEGL